MTLIKDLKKVMSADKDLFVIKAEAYNNFTELAFAAEAHWEAATVDVSNLGGKWRKALAMSLGLLML